MRLAVDTNILISALLKKSLSRKLWFEAEIELCAPEYVVDELHESEAEILEKFDGSPTEFAKLENLLLKKIKLIRAETLLPFLSASRTIIEDEGDLAFIACALYLGCDIWSNDKDFKRQGRIRAWTTEELAKELGF